MKTIRKTVVQMMCVAFTSVSAFGQTQGTDLITLKSGETQLGTIVEQKPGEYVRLLQKPSGDTMKILLVEIDRMQKVAETAPIENVSVSITNDQQEPQEAAYNVRPYYLRLSASTGGGDWANIGLGISLMRSFNEDVQIGLGVDYFGSTGQAPTIDQILPVSLQVNYALQDMFKKRGAFMVGTKMGYGIVLNSGYYDTWFGVEGDLKNGLYLEPSLGYRFNFTKNTGIQIDLGYQYNNALGVHAINGDKLRRYHQSNIVFGGTLFF